MTFQATYMKCLGLGLAMLTTAMLATAASAQAPSAGQNAPADNTARTTAALMPLPSSLRDVAGNPYPVTADFRVESTGANSPLLQAAVERMLLRLSDRTGLSLTRPGSHTGTPALRIEVAAPSSPVQSLTANESYTLTVSAGGLLIKAPTELGALHALETLLQLVRPAGTGGYEIPAVAIDDQPRFPWRGLMIDCSRHFEPIAVLESNLDAMAAVKLNVFHWHLVDDQGFRIESKRFPKLTALGSDGDFYTQQQARDLVAYAHARGIRVVPEFEMPGHSAAWLVAYPELSSGTQPDGIRRAFGVSDTALDPTRDATYSFIADFLGEMTTVFPDEYVHIGGDETPAPDWKTNPRIVAFSKAHGLADNAALQAYFNGRVLTILTSLHRRMEGWDEILNPSLPKSVVIQSWRGTASLAAGAEQGYSGILSAPYYLDGMKPAGQMYLDDPIPADTPLNAAQQKLILGGEVCMWAEHLDARTIDSRIWPRTAALAERFWSPAGDRDVDDLYRRLQPVSLELEGVGTRQLTAEDVGLRSLAGTENIDALRDFASAFEPVGFGDRASVQHTDHFTPLTSFVDAVRPDPPVRYALVRATAAVIRQPGYAAARATLRQFFTQAAAAVPIVEAEMQTAPRLMLMHDRAEQLGTLAQIGLDALAYSQPGGIAAPMSWRSRSLAAIDAAAKPDALVRFHFLDSLKALVNAVPVGH